MNKKQIKLYYIDEDALLLRAIGGNRRTKTGAVVVMSQKAMTCRTCYAVVGGNHLVMHTNSHVSHPVKTQLIKGEQK